jgi:hypothetical protein
MLWTGKEDVRAKENNQASAAVPPARRNAKLHDESDERGLARIRSPEFAWVERLLVLQVPDVQERGISGGGDPAFRFSRGAIQSGTHLFF